MSDDFIFKMFFVGQLLLYGSFVDMSLFRLALHDCNPNDIDVNIIIIPNNALNTLFIFMLLSAKISYYKSSSTSVSSLVSKRIITYIAIIVNVYDNIFSVL